MRRRVLLAILLCVAVAAQAQDSLTVTPRFVKGQHDDFVSIHLGGIWHPSEPLDRGAYDISGVYGRRISSYMTVGAGLGLVWVNSKEGHWEDRYDWSEGEEYEKWVPDTRMEYVSMPVFVQVVVSRYEAKWSPVVSVDAGWFVPINSNNKELRIKGFFLRPMIGLSAHVSERDEIWLKVGRFIHRKHEDDKGGAFSLSLGTNLYF